MTTTLLRLLCARSGDATLDYGTLLGDGIELVVGSATLIDASRTSRAAGVGPCPGLRLLRLYAVGSTGATLSSVPAGAACALPLAEFQDAAWLRAKLEELPHDAPVTVVVGGGLTGIETAVELAERGRAVTLVCGRTPAPAFSAAGRCYIATWLSRHGVAVLAGVSVSEVRQDAVILDDGSADGPAGGAVRPSALTIWAAGFGVPDLAVASGLRTDPLGRLLTNETLTIVDDDRVVAAGDAAARSGRPLRMSGYAAGPLGAQAADTVLSRIAGTRPAVLDLAFSGACVSLGRHAAVRQLARKDDTAVNVYIRRSGRRSPCSSTPPSSG
ncbi:FAD-dependent oxidoreductase [Streptomyces sp. NPDC048349]|uniref:FAD-dependent oxidoreductase n=1 Tax=Streptomyces sp. NPDC048349 TaxID=3155486 RepID=UPI00343327B9